MQVVIVPIWKKGDEKGVVMEAVASVQNTLKEAGIRVKVDDSELRTPGWKFNFYEMKVMTLLLVKLHFSYFFYSLRSILLFANTDVSTKICLNTSTLSKSIMDRREYFYHVEILRSILLLIPSYFHIACASKSA
jgi:hypothetical protein